MIQINQKFLTKILFSAAWALAVGAGQANFQ